VVKRDGRPTAIIEETLSRRSLLDWMGKATVLGLTGGVISACLDDDELAMADAGRGGGPDGDADGDTDRDPGAGDGGGADAAGQSDGSVDEVKACKEGDFPFEPGSRTHEVFGNWGERTVDPQDLEQILKEWKLTVDGMVQEPFTLSFAELLALKRQDQVVDFHCVEGWSIHDVPWNGVHLATLFDMARVKKGATHVTFHTVEDAYNESLPLDVALEPRTLLAYGIDCNTLPLQHGFPLRLIVPRKYAYKSPKYVYRIELTDHPIDGYWVDKGYPYDGDVSENRLRPGKY
jgi:hypothetical protein